jgi:hypothetical protein
MQRTLANSLWEKTSMSLGTYSTSLIRQIQDKIMESIYHNTLCKSASQYYNKMPQTINL